MDSDGYIFSDESSGRVGDDRTSLESATSADIDLLHHAGVFTAGDLQHADTLDLTERLASVNEQYHLAESTPTLSQVSDWIDEVIDKPTDAAVDAGRPGDSTSKNNPTE